MLDIDQVRIWSHVATASLLAALSITTFLLRGQQIVLQRGLIASLSFALASAWFWGLSATVKEHAIFSRADLIPALALIELSFALLGWTWFVYMATQTFTIERRRDSAEVTS